MSRTLKKSCSIPRLCKSFRRCPSWHPFPNDFKLLVLVRNLALVQSYLTTGKQYDKIEKLSSTVKEGTSGISQDCFGPLLSLIHQRYIRSLNGSDQFGLYGRFESNSDIPTNFQPGKENWKLAIDDQNATQCQSFYLFGFKGDIKATVLKNCAQKEQKMQRVPVSKLQEIRTSSVPFIQSK